MSRVGEKREGGNFEENKSVELAIEMGGKKWVGLYLGRMLFLSDHNQNLKTNLYTSKKV